jgi:hypothetical protein
MWRTRTSGSTAMFSTRKPIVPTENQSDMEANHEFNSAGVAIHG